MDRRRRYYDREMFRERFLRDERESIIMDVRNLQCGECGFLSKTVDTAQEHAKSNFHTNFLLSEEPFIDLHCCSCPTYCNSDMALELHKKTGHTEYEDTEAKRKREEAEEARRKEEAIQAVLEKLVKEEEEKRRIEEEKQHMSQTRLVAKQLKMILCLQSLKKSLKFVDQEERALNTLVTIVKNVAEKPDEEKYRRLRISIIEKRLGYVEAGIEFLELCKFEKVERGEFLVMPRYEVEEELLTMANNSLSMALSKVVVKEKSE